MSKLGGVLVLGGAALAIKSAAPPLGWLYVILALIGLGLVWVIMS